MRPTPLRLCGQTVLVGGQQPFSAIGADDDRSGLWIVIDDLGRNAVAFADGLRACFCDRSDARYVAAWLNLGAG